MYHPLVPCPSCARHIRTFESSCPFCATALPHDLASRIVPGAGIGSKRLNRGALAVFTASLAVTGAVAGAVTGCGGSDSTTNPPGPTDGAAESAGDGSKDSTPTDGPTADADVADEGGPVTLYGGPTDTGTKPDAGPDDDGGSGAKYGAPPFAP